MKTENINVAIFPIGSVIKLKKEFLKRSDGSSEYYKLIWLLCRQSAISRITLVQKSDWDKLSDEEKIEIDPRGVIFDVYSELGLRTPMGVTNTTKPEATYYLWEALKDYPKPDFGIGFPAQGFAMINIPNFLPQLRDPSKLCAALNMTVRYAGPIVNYINRSEIDWYWIATDPRYCESKIKRRDVANIPLEILAQYNDSIELTTMDEYRTGATETSKKIKVVYTGIEKLNLVNETIVSPDTERPTKFSIVAMQSSYGKENIKDYRFNALKKWVFKYDENKEAAVYGKWADIFTKDNPQFKGFIAHNEVDEMFSKTRYTLVIPIRPHWVTSKYAEMLRVGVVPFLHPDYDTQYNIIEKDHFIRLKDPEDFYKKMQYLDENPEKRIALVKSLQLKLLKGVRKGEFVIEMLNKHNQANGLNIEIPFDFNETVHRVAKKTVKLF